MYEATPCMLASAIFVSIISFIALGQILVFHAPVLGNTGMDSLACQPGFVIHINRRLYSMGAHLHRHKTISHKYLALFHGKTTQSRQLSKIFVQIYYMYK